MAALNDQNFNLFSVFWTNHLLSSNVCARPATKKQDTPDQEKKRAGDSQIRDNIMLVFVLEKNIEMYGEITTLFLLHKMPTVQHKQYR